ncbi:glycosyltransferase [Brasilonema sp. CT11]|nr:glycosyltransferase [Brasilonema sp. CT11]
MPSELVQRTVSMDNSLSHKIQVRQQMRRNVSLQPNQHAIGNVLISYVIESFVLKPGKSIWNSHTDFWECYQMAHTFLDMGYCVNVIQYYNDIFLPRKEYAFFIETPWNLQRCLPFLNADTVHFLFHNAAQANRLLGLQKRRGVTLRPRRFKPPNQALEHAECATVLGNEFTTSTFRYGKKPSYRIPISAQVVYPWLKEKDFNNCRNNFLWFGSGGLVHKGLDLVLEALIQMPDLHLTICGSISQEEYFVKAFYQELYQTPNIHTMGWIDVNSQNFRNIFNSCVGIVYSSCSEGGGGSVINCMHAGLIPIVSYQASVDVQEDYGVILKDSSIKQIKQEVQRISCLSKEKLRKMARGAWKYAIENHTRENLIKNYRNTIEKIRTNYDPKNEVLIHA